MIRLKYSFVKSLAQNHQLSVSWILGYLTHTSRWQTWEKVGDPLPKAIVTLQNIHNIRQSCCFPSDHHFLPTVPVLRG